MGQAELHIIRARLYGGKMNKAIPIVNESLVLRL